MLGCCQAAGTARGPQRCVTFCYRPHHSQAPAWTAQEQRTWRLLMLAGGSGGGAPAPPAAAAASGRRGCELAHADGWMLSISWVRSAKGAAGEASLLLRLAPVTATDGGQISKRAIVIAYRAHERDHYSNKGSPALRGRAVLAQWLGAAFNTNSQLMSTDEGNLRTKGRSTPQNSRLAQTLCRGSNQMSQNSARHCCPCPMALR